MAKDWIQTVTCKKINPAMPNAADLNWDDIATGLSNLCRYTGQVRDFYSVAQHSILVSQRALALAMRQRLSLAQCMYVAQWGLIHDAAEAYMADIARPVKHQPFMAGYRIVEQQLQSMIAVWSGLGPAEPEMVKQADMDVYATEVRDLKQPKHPDWIVEGEPMMLPIVPMDPKPARLAFLRLAGALGLKEPENE